MDLTWFRLLLIKLVVFSIYVLSGADSSNKLTLYSELLIQQTELPNLAWKDFQHVIRNGWLPYYHRVDRCLL